MGDGCGRKIGPYDCCTIVTGDARELAKAIPDGSVDLIFTDPVYDRIDDYRWLGEIAFDKLSEKGSLLAFCANEMIPIIGDVIDESIPYARLLTIFHSGVNVGKLVGRWFSKTTPCLVFGRGPRRMMWDISVASTNKSQFGDFHSWGKDPKTVMLWTEKFTDPDSLVVDPFCGGGTVPAVCKMLGRHYLAFEIEPDAASRARERVRNTQPPLFVVQVEQMGLEDA